jgi:hypothetical protein
MSSWVTRDRALAEGGADTVGAGIAAADDDDMLAAGDDRMRRPRHRLDRLAADAPVLLHQIGHRVMHAARSSPGMPAARGVSEPPQ